MTTGAVLGAIFDMTTGARAGFATRGPAGRSHGHRDANERFGITFVGISGAFVSAFSMSLLEEDPDPVKTLLRYPKSESPSTELCRVKFGIDFSGLGVRDNGGDADRHGRLYKVCLLSVCMRCVSETSTLGLMRTLIGAGCVGDGVERVAPASESVL